MRFSTRILAVASVIAAGAASSALAAPVTAYGAYDATSVNTGGNLHTIWLEDFLGANDADDYWQFVGGPGLFEFDGTTDPDEARLGGTIAQNTDTSNTFDISFVFSYRPQGQGGMAPKNGGGGNPATWDYFDFVSGTATGTGGAVNGTNLSFTIRPSADLPAQLGDGANDKNLGLGFSSWVFWDDGSTSGIGDINLNLAFVTGSGYNPPPVPLPASALLLIGAMGAMGAAARMRRKTG